MDSLDLIYIRKVFSLFMYVTPERRLWCKVWKWNFWFKKRRHRHYFYYHRRLANGGKMYCLMSDGTDQSRRVDKDVRLM